MECVLYIFLLLQMIDARVKYFRVKSYNHMLQNAQHRYGGGAENIRIWLYVQKCQKNRFELHKVMQIVHSDS